MFNWCVFIGVVFGGLKFDCGKNGHALITFQLAIQFMDKPLGKIEILCSARLAHLAIRYLRQGDRVAVMGFLAMREWQSDAGERHNDATLTDLPPVVVPSFKLVWGSSQARDPGGA